MENRTKVTLQNGSWYDVEEDIAYREFLSDMEKGVFRVVTRTLKSRHERFQDILKELYGNE